jgi:putative hemolysin
MGSMWLLLLIMTLIFANGLFACMEIALVSVPRARLSRYQKEHRAGASTALALQKNIDAFFATVQVGMTFMASLTSAIGGASAVELFSPVIEKLGMSSESTTAHVIAVLAITVTISYVTLIIGELAPKSLARRYPGTLSLFLAKPFYIFSRVVQPVIWVLTSSTRLVLRAIGIGSTTRGPSLTPEEFRLMASELVESRQLPSSVYDMLVRITGFSQIRVEDVMIPRHKIVAIRSDSKQDPQLRDKILKTYGKHPFTNFPVIDRKGDNILGMVSIKDLVLQEATRNPVKLLKPPMFIARGQTLDRVLATLQGNNVHLGVVVDEHGTVDGIISLEDIVEELVGEIEGTMIAPHEPIISSRENQYIIVDGLITLHEFEAQYGIALPHSLYYSTLAGFVLDQLGKIPAAGDHTEYKDWRIEVLEMDRNRIKRLKIVPLKTLALD